ITPPLKLLDQMFYLERGWRDLTPTKRKELRQEQLKPVIKQFWQWCDQAVATSKSRLGRALTYAQNQRSALDRVLDYGEIDLSNNATERNVKSFVIGRKNWLFATSPAGAGPRIKSVQVK
ncbi:transposase, partial [Loigolactobacillus coryniformis]|uniref:IS66 family transposase n=1 Tax=Loigolactobacillus coryniformis TaxID=1610 RepID=UPI003F23A0F6